jgi:hypothetical protein
MRISGIFTQHFQFKVAILRCMVFMLESQRKASATVQKAFGRQMFACKFSFM